MINLLTLDQLQADDVVLLQQHMLAPVELDLVLVTLVKESVETSLPQPCK